MVAGHGFPRCTHCFCNKDRVSHAMRGEIHESMEYVGIRMESVGVSMDYVGILMEYVGRLMKYAGI